MNNSKLYTPRDLDALQARFALRVTALLTERAEQETPRDVSERLRFARESALERARALRQNTETQAATAVQAGGGVARLLGGQGSAWWLKLASVVPLVMLVAGLSVIDELNDRTQIAAAAEIDVALLSDDLPPDAYRDEGFLEFLKTAQE